MILHFASICAAADVELDGLSSEAKAMIRSNAVDRQALRDLADDLIRFRRTGLARCRITMSGGKLVAIPAT